MAKSLFLAVELPTEAVAVSLEPLGSSAGYRDPLNGFVVTTRSGRFFCGMGVDGIPIAGNVTSLEKFYSIQYGNPVGPEECVRTMLNMIGVWADGQLDMDEAGTGAIVMLQLGGYTAETSPALKLLVEEVEGSAGGAPAASDTPAE